MHFSSTDHGIAMHHSESRLMGTHATGTLRRWSRVAGGDMASLRAHITSREEDLVDTLWRTCTPVMNN
jgi:hypothetical protein